MKQRAVPKGKSAPIIDGEIVGAVTTVVTSETHAPRRRRALDEVDVADVMRSFAVQTLWDVFRAAAPSTASSLERAAADVSTRKETKARKRS